MRIIDLWLSDYGNNIIILYSDSPYYCADVSPRDTCLIIRSPTAAARIGILVIYSYITLN